MPKSPKKLAVARQWQILRKLAEASPGLTVCEITKHLTDEEFDVSKRTVERDLNDLSEQFAITSHRENNSPSNRWHFIPGKNLELGSMGLMEAFSLALAGELLDQMLPPAMDEAFTGKIEQARAKLRSLNKHPLSRWSNKVRYVPPTLSFRPPRLRPNIICKIQTALIEEKQLRVRYSPFNKTERELSLHPLSLILRGSVPYLIATINDHTDVRALAIHRIQSAQVLPDNIQVPESYSVDNYINCGGMEFGSGDLIRLKATLHEHLAEHLEETPLAEDQKISYSNNPFTLTATVRDTWQLHFWILSQGDSITIRKPASLRNRIHSVLSSSLQQYQPTSP